MGCIRMAKIILKSYYLQKGESKHAKTFVKYIATREGVQKIDDSWLHRKVTNRQKVLIKNILNDFPDSKNSFEYEDYTANANMKTASEFINRSIENNADRVGKRKNYVEYIAKRPRAERNGAHGLFTAGNIPIDLSKVCNEIGNHDGNVWTHILSLRREDAQRLGFDHATAWKNLVCSQAPKIAQNMKIPIRDMRWYAAFHDESYHPHIHMVIYSVGKEPYLTKQGIKNIKSAFAREIFKADLIAVYQKQTQSRDQLTQTSRDFLFEIREQMHTSVYDDSILMEKLLHLSEELKNYTGRKMYGYLPKATRSLVDSIVDELTKNENISKLYNLWYEQRDIIVSTYQDEKEKRIPLSENKEFRQIKNAVIKEVVNILDNPITFEEPLEDISTAQNSDEPKQEAKKDKDDKLTLETSYNLYFRAKDFSQDDPSKAVELLKESCNLGNSYAQYQLGKMLFFGQGVPSNPEQGMKLLETSAKQRNPYATKLLTNLYTGNTNPRISLISFKLLANLSQMFEDRLQMDREIHTQKIDKKLLRKMDEKKQQHGMKME